MPGFSRMFILVLFALYSSHGYGQDYRFYYRQTQLAEEALLNEDLDAALEYYETTFDKYDFKFARDCYIAAQVAAYLKRDELTLKYLSYCLIAGVRYNCLFNTPVLKKISSSNIAKQLEKNKDSLWTLYLKRIDISLNKEFTARYDEEQTVKNGDKKRYYEVVEENLRRISELTKKGKYPGEKILGIMNSVTITMNNANHYYSGDCEFNAHFATPTLQHYSYAYDLLKTSLVEAMYKGQISPQEFVTIFIFDKSRWVGYPKSPPRNLEILIENSIDSNLLFSLPFERQKTDTATANKNRNDWFIPRIGTKNSSRSLVLKYGIAIAFGDWAGD